MKTKPIIVALATLLIGSLFLWACQDDNILSGIPDMKEHNALKSGQAETVTDGNVVKMVPFRGSGTWWYAAPPKFEEDEVEIVVALEGHATHLGRFQGIETYRFKFMIMEDAPVPTEYLSHSSIFTAANGDELHNEGSVEHGSVHEFYKPLGTGFSLTGVQFVGGTGRFENAAGWYDFSVNKSHPDDSGGTWELEGEISFGKMAPFRGSGTWWDAAEPEPGDGEELVSFITIEGTATHLGRFQGYETFHIKVFWMNGVPVPYAYVKEYGKFTAANGDEMHFEGCAEEFGSELILFDDFSGFLVKGVHLVGGTGRFENAVGWYDIWVTFSDELDRTTGTWELKGEISTVGSTRRGR